MLQTQDFKEKLLEAKQVVIEEEEVIDDLFGDNLPEPYILRKANYKELFYTPRGRNYESKMQT